MANGVRRDISGRDDRERNVLIAEKVEQFVRRRKDEPERGAQNTKGGSSAAMSRGQEEEQRWMRVNE